MKPEKAAELFAMDACGIVARMYLNRNVPPSDYTMEALRTGNITVREIAEIAHTLGFRVEISVTRRGNA